MKTYTLTADDLYYLEELAAAWQLEHDEATRHYGIEPMHHDYARLVGALRRIKDRE